jgi:HAD superfamily hydrolase (TIGR01450 family)
MDDLLSQFDGVLLDLDGTVYHGATVIDGVPEAIRAVREREVSVRFVTNNASKSPDQVVEHLNSVGIAVAKSEIKTSAQAGAGLLGSRLRAGDAVLVIGTDSLAAEVAHAGFQPIHSAAGAQGVIQGHSPRTDWPMLAEACIAIRAGAFWVACNSDSTLPTERGLLPGNGAMVAALRTATDANPVVAGKPETPLFNISVAKTDDHAAINHALVVGDRLDTDIAGAVAANFESLLVLTGVTTARDLLTAPPSQRPDYVARDLTSLTDSAERLRVGAQAGWQVELDGQELIISRGASDDADDAIALLRALCTALWESGAQSWRAVDDLSLTALRELDLTSGA